MDGSKQINEYVSVFDDENKALRAQLEESENEKNRLIVLLKSANKNKQQPGDILIRRAKETDFIENEAITLIISILKERAQQEQENSRRHHIIEDIINSNKIKDCRDELRGYIKNILKSYDGLDQPTRSEFRKIGFSIEEDGKHYKITYNSDDRYKFTLSKTPSDHRGGQNLASDIIKKIL